MLDNISPMCDRKLDPDGLDASFISIRDHYVTSKLKIWCDIFQSSSKKPGYITNYPQILL